MRAYRERGNKGKYVNLTIEQQVYIIQNKFNFTNPQIAKQLGVTLGTVEYFKKLLNRKDSDITDAVSKPINKKEVIEELEALLHHTHSFPSFSNGAYNRIKVLFNTLINKYK